MTTKRSIAVLALGLALAGCGGGKTDDGGAAKQGDVASLPSAAAATGSSSTAQDRPLIRTDTSDEEETRLWAVYTQCMEEHGFSKKAISNGGPVPGPSVEAAANKACEGKRPEQVWERAKRTDPLYNDKLRDWVTCVRASGIDAWEENGFITFKSLPPDDQMKKVDDCQDKAFGKG